MTGAAPTPAAAVVPGRIGILGGTFDPIHVGHLALAEEAREALGLERVVFIPAGDPWQKANRAVTPAGVRLAMVEAATAGNAACSVSRIEIERDGPTYTAETLEELAAAERAAGRTPDLWFILSVEALGGLATWHRPERVLEIARLAVAPRGGADGAVSLARFRRDFPSAGDRVILLDGPDLRISATSLRARVAAGRSIRYLVPAAVETLIAEYALYRPAAPSAAATSS